MQSNRLIRAGSVWEFVMGIMMVKCPKTGRAIPTGTEIDQASFNRTPVFFGRTFCPICKIDHEWFAKDAWVSEAKQGVRIDRPTATQR